MLAYSLGIYEKIIEAVTNFFGNVKANIKLLFNFGIGVMLAIMFFSKILLFLLNNYYGPIMYLFLGLIIGTLVHFTKQLKINKKNILLFLITLIIFIFLSSSFNFDKFIYTGSFINILYISLLGSIDALTSIVPGISGTAIFMMLGSYEFILSVLANPFSLEFIVYGIGLIIGIVVICFIMNYLLKNKKNETNSCVFALMLGSIFVLFLTLYKSFSIINVLLLIFGIIFGFKCDK